VFQNLAQNIFLPTGTFNATAAVTAWMSMQPNTSWASAVQGLQAAASTTASNQWLSGKYLFLNP